MASLTAELSPDAVCCRCFNLPMVDCRGMPENASKTIPGQWAGCRQLSDRLELINPE